MQSRFMWLGTKSFVTIGLLFINNVYANVYLSIDNA